MQYFPLGVALLCGHGTCVSPRLTFLLLQFCDWRTRANGGCCATYHQQGHSNYAEETSGKDTDISLLHKA